MAAVHRIAGPRGCRRLCADRRRLRIAGLRTSFGAFTIGINAEFQFRPGSVVSAASPNFAGQTYYGTVDPHTNLLLMGRIGWTFGRP